MSQVGNLVWVDFMDDWYDIVWFTWISLLYPKGHSWWQLKLSRTGQSTLPTHKLGIQSISPGIGGHVPHMPSNFPEKGVKQSPLKSGWGTNTVLWYREAHFRSSFRGREAPSVLSLYQHCWWPLHDHTGRQPPADRFEYHAK